MYDDDMKSTPLSDFLLQSSINAENQLMDFSDSGKIVQTLTEVKEHILSFIKVVQLTMAHMFQNRLLNQVHKVSTMQHKLQEWL